MRVVDAGINPSFFTVTSYASGYPTVACAGPLCVTCKSGPINETVTVLFNARPSIVTPIVNAPISLLLTLPNARPLGSVG